MIDFKDLLRDVFIEMDKNSTKQKAEIRKDLKKRGKLMPDETTDWQFLNAKDFFEFA